MATSERAAPKDRPPLFCRGRGSKSVGGAVAPGSRASGREDANSSPLDDPTLDAAGCGWP